MKQTSKIVGIDNMTGSCIVYSSKGVLSQCINVPRTTIVNWFRLSNRCVHNDITYYRASQYMSNDKKNK